MNDDLLEQRIRETLRRAAPSDVPSTLETRAARIPATVPVQTRRARIPRLGSWRLPAAVGIVVATVAIVALAVLWLPFRTPAPSPVSAVTPSAVPTLTPSPVPVATWQPVAVSGLTGGTVLQVVSGPAGLLAVGVDDPSAAEQRPRIWTSSDGRSWQAMTEIGDAATRPDTFAIAAAPWRNGWVVVAESSAWASADGKTWTFADLGAATAWGVAASDERIVAVGYQRVQGADNWSTPAVWTSTDGATWVPTSAFPAGRAFGNLWGVTRVTGGFLAYGFVHEDASLPPDGSEDARVAASAGIPWFSSDGDTWSRVTETSETGPFAGSWVTAVVPGGPGFVAIGHPAGGVSTPWIWTSSDGRAWTRQIGILPFASVGDAAMGLGGDGRRVVAFVAPTAHRESQLWNQEESTAAGRTTIAWTSSDGVAWQELPGLSAFPGRLIDVVPLGGLLYAIGTQAAPAAACPWLTPSASPGTATASPVQGPPACSRTSVWVLP